MEQIITLNERLIDYFGVDTVTGQPMFRIVWANDQTEKRMVGEVQETGIQLVTPIVMEVRKYPYLMDLYVLEQLVLVPEINQKELPESKMSYEPLWAYRDAEGNPVPPIWHATKFVIDTLYAAMGKRSMAKYVDDEKNTTPEGREQRITEMQLDLFGNETDMADALRHGSGVVVPSNYKNREDN